MAGETVPVYARNVGRSQEGTVAPAAGVESRRERTIASFPPVISQNPYQRLLYDHLENLGFRLEANGALKAGWLLRNRPRVGILHFHWAQNYYYWLDGPRWTRRPLSWARLMLFGVRLALARALGYRIAWTVHQVYPHESIDSRLDRAAGRLLAGGRSHLIAHDRATATTAERELGLPPESVAVVPHGSYAGMYGNGRPREVVRAELGIEEDAFVFLSFGHVRAYKEINLLLSAFGAVDVPHATLLVAGLPLDSESADEAAAAAQANPRIKMLLGFVPDERVAELFQACDACVFARGDGGTSGALILALSFARPVVVADVDAYRELADDGAAGWFFAPGDADSLRAALEAATRDPAVAAEKASAAARVAESLAWPSVAPLYASALTGAVER